jgi:hypothetical protein
MPAISLRCFVQDAVDMEESSEARIRLSNSWCFPQVQRLPKRHNEMVSGGGHSVDHTPHFNTGSTWGKFLYSRLIRIRLFQSV